MILEESLPSCLRFFPLHSIATAVTINISPMCLSKSFLTGLLVSDLCPLQVFVTLCKSDLSRIHIWTVYKLYLETSWLLTKSRILMSKSFPLVAAILCKFISYLHSSPARPLLGPEALCWLKSIGSWSYPSIRSPSGKWYSSTVQAAFL